MPKCAVSEALTSIQIGLDGYASFEPYRHPRSKVVWMMATSRRADRGTAFDKVTVKSWDDDPALHPKEARELVERLLVALGVPYRPTFGPDPEDQEDREPHGYLYTPERHEHLSAHDKIEIIAAVRAELAKVVIEIPGLVDRCPDLGMVSACRA